MTDLNNYQNCIRQLLMEYAKYVSSNDEIEAQIITDTEGDIINYFILVGKTSVESLVL